MKKNKHITGSNTPDRRVLSRRDFMAGAALIGAGWGVFARSFMPVLRLAPNANALL